MNYMNHLQYDDAEMCVPPQQQKSWSDLIKTFTT